MPDLLAFKPQLTFVCAVLFIRKVCATQFFTSGLVNNCDLYRSQKWIIPPPPPPFPPVTMNIKTSMTEDIELCHFESLPEPFSPTHPPIILGGMDLTGPKGEKGSRGRRGEMGLPGPLGPEGPPGPPGRIGRPGEKGEKGEQGWVGISGEAGLPGTSKGNRGRVGSEGEKGYKGDPGPRGETGSAGYFGPDGLKGDTGPKGNLGLPGIRGMRGVPGKRGKPGRKGDQGLPGGDGHAGAEGGQGPTGEPGIPGKVIILQGLKGHKGMVGPSVKCNCSWANSFNPITIEEHQQVPSIYIVDKEQDMAELKWENMMVLRRDTRTLYIYSGSSWKAVRVPQPA